jgi:hypothetical protein
MVNFFGTWGGFVCGFGGFLTAIASLLYARARVAQFERSVHDIDWQVLSELTLDVQKLKKASQKWQNNANAMEKVSSKEMFEMALAEKLQQQKPTSNIRMIER